VDNNLVYEYKTEEEKEALKVHDCLIDQLLDDCLEKLMPELKRSGNSSDR
jgi:hypothetical protein